MWVCHQPALTCQRPTLEPLPPNLGASSCAVPQFSRKPRLRIERHLILDRVVYSVRLGLESLTPLIPDIETLKIVRAAVDLKDKGE